MSYEKQTWQTGDVVTSAKLNHMEDGIAAGGAFVVHATWDEDTETVLTLDKTWNEINEAAQVGPVYIFATWTDKAGTQVDVYAFGGTYVNQSVQGNTWFVNAYTHYEGEITDYSFSTDSADGYPAFTSTDG